MRKQALDNDGLIRKERSGKPITRWNEKKINFPEEFSGKGRLDGGCKTVLVDSH